jgi:hypothetical protein
VTHMLKTNTIERTEKGPERAQRQWGQQPRACRRQVIVSSIAALASALGRIERELRDSVGLAARRAL